MDDIVSNFAKDSSSKIRYWVDNINGVNTSAKIVPRADMIHDGRNRLVYWTIVTNRRSRVNGRVAGVKYYHYYTEHFKTE